jgi:hypothetical protein
MALTSATESMTTPLIVNQMRADECFAYLIADSDARDAALVDPRADRSRPISVTSRRGGCGCGS